MRGFLGRVSEWAVARPTQTLAGVIALVAIVGVVGALRLTPDAGTTKLVDNGSSAYEGTEEFRERFGDDAIVVLARGDLQKLVLRRKPIRQLLRLEACLSGNAPSDAELVEGDDPFPDVCEEIKALDATRVVFGPATFLNQAATEAENFLREEIGATLARSQEAQARALRRAQRQGLSDEEAAAAGAQARADVIQEALVENRAAAEAFTEFQGAPALDNQLFVSAVVFDSRQPAGTPKARFGYLFPSPDGALVSIRLEPDLDDETRREAIGLIREAVGDESLAIKDSDFEISGVPVVVEGLANELGGEIALMLVVALVVMALTLIVAFGPPLRLLPLFVALAASAMAFGVLSIVGGSLTMASVAVLPVVIGLGVDYAIQLQSRFRESRARGERPAPAAVIAAVRGGPVIATAAVATTVGFLSLLLSPIPMVREFAFALAIGVLSALAISLTAGLAALSVASEEREGRGLHRLRSERLDRSRRSLTEATSGARESLARGRARGAELGNRALALAIRAPGRVLVAALILAVVGWAASTRTEVVSDISELVPEDLPALQSVNALEDVTGVSGEVDVIVSGEDVTSPEAITWMRDFKEGVLADHGFAGEFPNCQDEGTELCPGPALPDLIRTTGEPNQARIDSVIDAVPDYFLQAILSRPEGGEQVAGISFLIPVMPLDEQEALIEEIRADLDPPPGISAEVVGLPVLVADANAELSGSRYWLPLLSLLAVALVLFAVMRDLRRVFVPLVPIALATGWSALVIEAMGVSLNPMSATLGVLVIAVTTEFSVILSSRYREERDGGKSIGDALRTTYSRTGTAVLVSGITSIAGFGVLIVSEITMLRDFGLVTIVDLTVALLGVMLVLPATLVWADGGFRPLPALRSRLRRSGSEPAVVSGSDG
ncbi:MAG TPA: MMPL family transporter [Solirubrobacterales bacterium]|nr:MMPL family transporter [Solirubrobacterales bacterium]